MIMNRYDYKPSLLHCLGKDLCLQGLLTASLRPFAMKVSKDCIEGCLHLCLGYLQYLLSVSLGMGLGKDSNRSHQQINSRKRACTYLLSKYVKRRAFGQARKTIIPSRSSSFLNNLIMTSVCVSMDTRDCYNEEFLPL